MRRLILLLLLPLPLAAGAAPPGPPPRRSQFRPPGAPGPRRPDPHRPWSAVSPPARAKAGGAAPVKAGPGEIPFGPTADAAVALQAAVDGGASFGRTVKLPQAPDYRYVGSPVYLDGSDVTVAGDGPGSVLSAGSNGYEGPVLAVGVGRLEKAGLDPKTFRVPNAVDPARTALDTQGKAALLVTAHPLQLGAGWPPDNWTGPQYTWEFVIGPGAGRAWPASTWLWGVTNGNEGVNPFALITGGDNGEQLRFLVQTANRPAGQWDEVSFPAPGGFPGGLPRKITVQLDFATHTWYAAVDDVTAAVTPSPGMAAATGMLATTGGDPFVLGGRPQDPAPLVVHGFIVHAGPVYDPARPTLTRLDGQPVDPARWSHPGPQTVAHLPLTDGPATHVRADAGGAGGVGFWVPPRPASVAASNVAVRDLTLLSKLQSPVVLGWCYGLTYDTLTSLGGLQGVAGLPIEASYPVTARNCTFGGVDCAYYGWRQVLSARDTTVSYTGRDGVRCGGGTFLWDGTVFTFSQANTETFFKKLSDDYGGNVALSNMLVDNESGGPAAAIVSVDQSYATTNEVAVTGVAASTLNQGVFVRLVGRGNGYVPGNARVGGLSVFAATDRPALQVDGPAGSWRGSLDLRGNNANAPAGDLSGFTVAPASR